MKKTKLILIAIVFFMFGSTFAQDNPVNEDWLAKSSWAFGFGIDYPRYISTNLTDNYSGVGGLLSIQRNFTEHVGLRLLGGYNYLAGNIGSVRIKNSVISGDLDLMYYLVPCEAISPYLTVGVGGVYYKLKNSPEFNNNSYSTYSMNVGFGAEWSVAPDWKITTELGYHEVAQSYFDGVRNTVGGGILGGTTDSYMTFSLGGLYYFGKGEKSHYCDLYNGVDQVDYAKIEDIVKKYQTQPTEVDYNRIADIVKNNTPKVAPSTVEGKWVLIGVNFDFNKASLRPESLPILSNAAEILLTHPDVNVEIAGYTDNIGSEKYNKKLSLERANAVKEFMVAKGVAANRMTTVGMGESDPVASNKTAEGRMLNRRIEFKVK